MPTAETSTIIKLLIIIAVVLTMFAWWLSERFNKRTRVVIAYLKSDHQSFWRALPWHARNLNTAAAIEAFRRSGNAADPKFLALYAARKSSSRTLAFAIAIAMTPIAIVMIGTAFFGWTW